LAEALRLQKTYVSRVLRGQAHFNSDQLYQCCLYLGLNDEDSGYLSLLLEFARSSVPQRKKRLQGKIHQLQTDRRKIQRHLRAKMVEPEPASGAGARNGYIEYYLDPRAALVHVYMNLVEYRRNPYKIKQVLGIPEKQFRALLKLLERLEIIRWSPLQSAYDLLLDHIHLPKESPLTFPSEELTRIMAIEHMRKLTADQRFHYSFTFAADEKTRAVVHDEFLKFLRHVEAVIKPAPSEEVYHMAFDLFPWKAPA
jgi:hypothetical protein